MIAMTDGWLFVELLLMVVATFVIATAQYFYGYYQGKLEGKEEERKEWREKEHRATSAKRTTK